MEQVIEEYGIAVVLWLVGMTVISGFKYVLLAI